MEALREKFRAAPVTVTLAAACAVIYLLEVLLLRGGRSPDMAWWALSGDALAQGRWWTLVTHLFLHGNLLHLAVNVAGLWFIGPEVEYMLGRFKFTALYVISGAAGGLLQTAFSLPTAELIGASGSVCGLLLSFTTAYPNVPLRALLFFVLPVSLRARTLGFLIMGVSLVCAALHILPQVGHLAHLGGAVAGALLTWWWLPSVPPRVAAASQVEREAQTEELLTRVVQDGIESLSREERRQLEGLAGKRRSRW